MVLKMLMVSIFLKIYGSTRIFLPRDYPLYSREDLETVSTLY